MENKMRKKIWLLMGMILTVSLLAACANKNPTDQPSINVGYFPNLSHAPAMVGIEKNFFQQELEGYQINTMTFPNGSLFMDALATDQIDIGYVGPGPVLNRFLQGDEIAVISNASRGENVLVVRNDIEFNDIKDLDGKIVATPSTGCTHDLILRKMLKEAGMAVEENGGTVKRIAQKPATMIGLFQQKQIDAALVSEPWASLMESQGVVRVVRDAKEVAWNGNLPATVLVVKKSFLESNPEAVDQFLNAHEASIDYINTNKQETIEIVSKQIKEITNEEIEKSVLENSMKRVEFTTDLDKMIMQEVADFSKELGFVEGDTDLTELLKTE